MQQVTDESLQGVVSLIEILQRMQIKQEESGNRQR
jgi:hypothetical protein